jgi:hypothetical protein
MKTFQISNQSFPELPIKNLKECLQSDRLYLHRDNLFVFVCGSESNPNHPSARELLINYANKQFPEHRFFMAENFFKIFGDKEKDLLSIEDDLAKYSDCIIIILDGPGAITELGAFAMKETLAKILLPINDKKFKETKSFISLGPIVKVNKKSIYKPVIYTHFESILDETPIIEARLSKAVKKNNKKVELKTIGNFYQLSPKEKIYFILDIITLFQPISKEELPVLFEKLFGEHNIDIDFHISLLIALGLVKENNNYFFKTIGENHLFYNYLFYDTLTNRSSVLNHYFKYNKLKISILNNRIL